MLTMLAGFIIKNKRNFSVNGIWMEDVGCMESLKLHLPSDCTIISNFFWLINEIFIAKPQGLFPCRKGRSDHTFKRVFFGKHVLFVSINGGRRSNSTIEH